MFHVTGIEFVCVIKGKYDIPENLIFFIDDKEARLDTKGFGMILGSWSSLQIIL